MSNERGIWFRIKWPEVWDACQECPVLYSVLAEEFSNISEDEVDLVEIKNLKCNIPRLEEVELSDQCVSMTFMFRKQDDYVRSGIKTKKCEDDLSCPGLSGEILISD